MEGWTGRCYRLGNNKKVFDAETDAILRALEISNRGQESAFSQVSGGGEGYWGVLEILEGTRVGCWSLARGAVGLPE